MAHAVLVWLPVDVAHVHRESRSDWRAASNTQAGRPSMGDQCRQQLGALLINHRAVIACAIRRHVVAVVLADPFHSVAFEAGTFVRG